MLKPQSLGTLYIIDTCAAAKGSSAHTFPVPEGEEPSPHGPILPFSLCNGLLARRRA